MQKHAVTRLRELLEKAHGYADELVETRGEQVSEDTARRWRGEIEELLSFVRDAEVS